MNFRLPPFIALALLPWQATAQVPTPEFYGFYAVVDGKLVDMYTNSALNDYRPDVEFVIYSRSPAEPKLFFIPPEKPARGSAEFTGWGDFQKSVNDYSKSMEMLLTYGVDASAIPIPFRTGPVNDNALMLRIAPSKTLPPGFYQLVRGVRFWIEKSKVEHLYGKVEGRGQSRKQPSVDTKSASAKKPDDTAASEGPPQDLSGTWKGRIDDPQGGGDIQFVIAKELGTEIRGPVQLTTGKKVRQGMVELASSGNRVTGRIWYQFKVLFKTCYAEIQIDAVLEGDRFQGKTIETESCLGKSQDGAITMSRGT